MLIAVSDRRPPPRAVPEWEDATRTDSPDDAAIDFEGVTGSFTEDAPTAERELFEEETGPAMFEDRTTAAPSNYDGRALSAAPDRRESLSQAVFEYPEPSHDDAALEFRTDSGPAEFVDGTELDLRLWAVKDPQPPLAPKPLPHAPPQAQQHPPSPKKSVSAPKVVLGAPVDIKIAPPPPPPSRWSADRFHVLKRSTQAPARDIFSRAGAPRSHDHAPLEPAADRPRSKTRAILLVLALIILGACSVAAGIAAVLYLDLAAFLRH
jgi:hypothetical protein